MEERDVDVARGKSRVGECAQHRGDVADALFLRPHGDVVDKRLIDVHRVHLAGRPHGLRHRQTDDAGAGAEIGDDLAGLQLQLRDDVVDFQRRDPLGPLQPLDPFGGGPGGELTRKRAWGGQCQRQQCS